MVDQTQDPAVPFTKVLDRGTRDACEVATLLLRRKGQRRMPRSASICLRSLTLVIVLVVAAGGLFLVRLEQGPIALGGLGGRIAASLDDRFGPGYDFTVGDTTIEKTDNGPNLDIAGLSLRSGSGRTIIDAPRAAVWLDPVGLLFGNVRPKRLEVYDVDVRLSVLADGSLAISAGSEPLILTHPLGTEPAPADLVASAAHANPALPLVSADVTGSIPTTVPPVAVDANVMARAAELLRQILDLTTGTDSSMGALERFGISHGRLVLDDKTGNQTTTFDGLELSFDKSNGVAKLTLSALGPNGRWSVTAQANDTPQGRSLAVDVKDLSFDEIALATGMRGLPIDFDMPITSQLQFGLDHDGKLSVGRGTFKLGAGYLYFNDPDHEPMRIDGLDGGFHWDAAAHAIDLDTTHYVSGDTQVSFSGTVTPPQTAQDPWVIDGASDRGAVYGREYPNDKPIILDRISLRASVAPAQKLLTIDHFEVEGAEVHAQLAGDFNWDGGMRLRLQGSGNDMPGRTVLRLWPAFIAAPVRNWFIGHLESGTLQKGSMAIDLTGAEMVDLHDHKPASDASTKIDFAFTNMGISFLPGVPSLTAMDGSGRVTGHTASFTATSGVLDAGNNRKVSVVGGSLTIPETSLKPAPANIDVHMTAPMDAVADILSRPALAAYASLPIDTATIKGQLDGHLDVDIKIGKDVPPEDTVVHGNANVTNFSVDKLLGKERLDQANLTVSVEPNLLKASGQGRMFGAPAQIELSKIGVAPTQASINLVLDDAARTKLGMNLGSALQGPISARIVSALGQHDTTEAKVDLDFSRAAINGLLPGFTKPAGKPAKATFSLVSDASGTGLNDIVFDAAPAAARGTVLLQPDGGFANARLSLLRLSPGDDMKVDATQSKDGLKIVARGNTFDVRALLKSMTGSSSGAATTGDFDLDLKSALVTGANKQALSNVALQLAQHNGVIRQFQLSGSFGHDPIAGSMTAHPRDGGEPQVSITTSDGGALLAFIDLYPRMEGGNLDLALRVAGSRTDGQLNIRNFILRDEPALRKIISEGVAQGGTNGDASRISIDPNAARFTRLVIGFSRSDGRIDLRDGAMYGQDIGATIAGNIDFARNRISLSGTFVPAYMVNNLFSKIPLFGPLLGGGTHEGLFGINYGISGPATAPVLNINPLSALAPGFLRKIFSAGEVTGQAPAGTDFPPMPDASPSAQPQ